MDGAEGAGGVVVGTGPGVVFACDGEAAFDGVAVNVADLFEALLFRADVEVVVARLPEVISDAEELFGAFLFQDSKGGGEGVVGGFGEEEVDVLGHKDVGVEVEAVGLADLFEDLFDDVLGIVSGEEREAVMAAEGDEVEIAGLLVTLQALGHGGSLGAVDLSVDGPLMAVGLP